jgi:hypothetical protein
VQVNAATVKARWQRPAALRLSKLPMRHPQLRSPCLTARHPLSTDKQSYHRQRKQVDQEHSASDTEVLIVDRLEGTEFPYTSDKSDFLSPLASPEHI